MNNSTAGRLDSGLASEDWMPTRVCVECKQETPLVEMAWLRGATDWADTCKKCHVRYLKNKPNQTAEGKRRGRAAHLRKAYGITQVEYDAMFEAQGGVCAICKQPQKLTRGGRNGTALLSMNVDHDHRTGEIRALLCFHCNQGIGQFGEDAERLRAAADYLEQWAKTRAG